MLGYHVSLLLDKKKNTSSERRETIGIPMTLCLYVVAMESL